MLKLLEQYSLENIIFFIVVLALALKQLIDFLDWAKARFKKPIEEEYEQKENKIELINKINEHTKAIEELTKNQLEIQEEIKVLSDRVNILLNSDKDDIKAWITEKHHYFCYEKGYIDDYSLDCIEKRYKHYVDEGGNSFAGTLMSELRALPKILSTK